MSSLNNNLSECITLGDSSLACQTRVSFGRSGLACIQGDQTCVSLHLPAPRGERKEHEQQNLHSTHSERSGVQHFQSSYLFALGKYQKTRWAQGALDSLWVWLQHTDWSKNRQMLLNTTSLHEEISSLILGFDSKSPLTNNSTISCAFFRRRICRQVFPLGTISNLYHS